MFTKIVLWIMKKAFTSKMRPMIEPAIKEMYRIIATENLNLSTKIVYVKKSKAQYKLVFFENIEGKLKFNIGRHKIDDHVPCGDLSPIYPS